MSKRPTAPIIAGLVLRVLFPWYGHGFRYMDEHWQVMEPAGFLVHGVWSRTVEWEEGLRSWIYPWLVSLPIRLAEAIGIQDPLWITSFVRSLHGVVSTAAIPLVYFVVRKLAAPNQRRGSDYALAAAWVVALWPFALYCGVHTHGEMAGALFVLGGVALPALVKSEAKAYLLAGVCFGVAFAFKIDVAVAGLGYGLWQLMQRRLRRAILLALGVLPMVFLVGIVDRLTWGSWFHNVLGHARVNLVESVGNQWGVSPWYAHVVYFFDIVGVPALLATVSLPLTWRKLPDALRANWFMNFFFVAVFCAIPHKEKRFLSPVLYSGIAAAFATLSYAASRISPKLRKTFLAIGLAVFAAHFASNVVVYMVRRPWWDRISAIRNAGRIPGVEKMLSPLWPAVYYLPRHIPAEVVEANPNALRVATSGLRHFSVAVDWKDLNMISDLGFRCEPWPSAPPVSPDPVPWAYHCKKLGAR